ncbi:MAG TPA: rhodanese-like domain-containing protein [Nocardioidaceae bacterium]|nr:rhodanese-like domain-containing protein [Nocardioidaceae bacterium]
MTETNTPEIDVEELAAARESGLLVDVREPEQYVAGHVPGAVPIPMSQLANRLDEIDKTSRVFVICASGNRSSAMTDLLRGAGFDAVSVAGGTGAWTRSGRPVEGGLA